MLLQDLTIEHTHPEPIAQTLPHLIGLGVRLDGFFICPKPPVIPYDEHPSHTVACYRGHHGRPLSDPAEPISWPIASVGSCMCHAKEVTHQRYATVTELSAAVLQFLQESDPGEFLRQAGHDGPFRGTDASVRVGYRVHYCSWHGRGLWLSFRHIYVGK